MQGDVDITAFANWPSLLVDDLRALPAGLSWRERFERVITSCEEHLYTWAEQSRSLALTLCNKFGVPSSEPVLGVSGDDSSVLVVTDRRLIFGYFDSMNGNGLVHSAQLFCDPAEVHLVVSSVRLDGSPMLPDYLPAMGMYEWVTTLAPEFREGYVAPTQARKVVGTVEAVAGSGRLWLCPWIWSLEREVPIEECSLGLPELADPSCIPNDVRNFAALLAAARGLESNLSISPVASVGEPSVFQPRLIRSYADAERAAADWLRAAGLTNVRLTPAGADGGVDVISDQAVAQVKAEMIPVGRPVVQQLAGIAAIERKDGIVFALAGYTAEAVAWADRAGVSLFRFDLQGIPEPLNQDARRLSQGTARIAGDF